MYRGMKAGCSQFILSSACLTSNIFTEFFVGLGPFDTNVVLNAVKSAHVHHLALLQANCAGLSTRFLRGRAEEETHREAEVKAIEAARYEREIELARQEAVEEKARRKEAYARCGDAGLCYNLAVSMLEPGECMPAVMQANVKPVSTVEAHPRTGGASRPSRIMLRHNSTGWYQIWVCNGSPGASCIGQA